MVEKEKKINLELFRYYFKYSSPRNKYIELNKTEREMNKVKVGFIENEIADLKKDTENVPKDDVEEIKMLNKIKDTFKLIFYFNNENQEGSGLRFLAPNQMLSRLPISLAQLKAEINSEKLKSEIRQLFHSFYRSKNLKKNIYKILAAII